MAEQTLSPRQRRIFWIALLAIPVVFFVLLEGGLRLGGYGQDTRLFAEVEAAGTRYYTVNPAVTGRYFSDPDFGTYVSRDRFRVEKPPGTYRIFALGASTTIGFPYMFNGSFSSLLRDRLYDRFPDRQFEVVNVGITAVNSYTVADVAREVMRHEPDLVVVYAGHNEFYGAFGVGSAETVGDRRWMVRTYLFAQRSRVFQLVRDGIRTVLEAVAPRPAADGRQLMERMARDREIAHGSPAYERAQRYFRANMAEVIEVARSRGVDILLSTLVSNLRDQEPFVSLHSEGVSDSARLRWARFFERGIQAGASGDSTLAVQFFEQAIALDGARADGRFHLARALESLGRHEDARREYALARDLDALRFRASSSFNDVLRDLAREKAVPLVDMEAAFDDASDNGIPGEALFWEHVHPTFDGYMLMGRTFAEAMRSNGLVASEAEWAERAERDVDFFRRFAGVTELDHEVARIRIEMLTNRWPFRSEPVPFSYRPETPVQQVAWAYIRGETGWAHAHDRLARLYRDAGDMKAAADELWAIAKVTPYDPHYALLAADLDAANRRPDRAAERYAFAVHVRDTPVARAKLGMSLFQIGDFQQASTHLGRAVTVRGTPALTQPQLLHAHYLLGLSQLAVGDLAGAAREAERLRQLAPEAPPTHQLAAAVTAAERAGGVVVRSGSPDTLAAIND